MSLKLSIISYQGRPPIAPNEITFDQEGGTIGRGLDNSWVLKDPENYVSGQHALIERRAPDYYITDTSANGVYVNHSADPLGKYKSIRLSHGDTLGIGEYEIAVSISEVEQRQPSPDQSDFAMHEDSPTFPQDPFTDLGSQPISDVIDKEEQFDADWIADANWQNSFPGAETENEINHRGSEPDHVPDLNAYFTPTPGANAEARAPRKQSEADQPSKEPPDMPENWMDLDAFEETETKAEAQPDIEPPRTRERGTSPPEKSVQSAAAAQTSETPSGINAETESLRRFLQGAGLDDNRIAQSLHPDMFYIIGKVLHTTVQGAMDVLMARADIKNEMRLDVTTLRSIKNNPIKFSFSVEEALTRLLTPQKEGYMPPVRAVEEAFEDIRAHQIAVLAGMQTALKSILKRFDPEALAQRLQKTSPLSASIPFHRQSKLWELFEQLYEEIGREAEDDFNHLFGRAFTKAYEEQIRKIKASAERNPIDSSADLD